MITTVNLSRGMKIMVKSKGLYRTPCGIGFLVLLKKWRSKTAKNT